MNISHGNISRFNPSIILIRIISINVRESLSHIRIKDTKTIITIALKQTLKSRYSLRRLDYKSSHRQATKVRLIRDLLNVLNSSKNNRIDNYFSHEIRTIRIRIVINIKIAFNLDLKRSIKLTSTKITQSSYLLKIFRINKLTLIILRNIRKNFLRKSTIASIRISNQTTTTLKK